MEVIAGAQYYHMHGPTLISSRYWVLGISHLPRYTSGNAKLVPCTTAMALSGKPHLPWPPLLRSSLVVLYEIGAATTGYVHRFARLFPLFDLTSFENSRCKKRRRRRRRAICPRLSSDIQWGGAALKLDDAIRILF